MALLAACSRQAPQAPPPGDAGGPREVTVRVPAGIRIARSLDALAVSFDPAARAPLTVAVDPGMALGVETEERVFPRGGKRPEAAQQHGLASGEDPYGGTSSYNASQGGIPAPGTRYEVEIEVVLFETDVPPGHMWDPHAGRYKELWRRTLRQAEE
jgi:hypothetical protein